MKDSARVRIVPTNEVLVVVTSRFRQVTGVVRVNDRIAEGPVGEPDVSLRHPRGVEKNANDVIMVVNFLRTSLTCPRIIVGFKHLDRDLSERLR